MMTGESWKFCEQILPAVSRSFALIIPRCPPPIDAALCVAYLICRLADTVEDEAALTKPQRDTLYDALLHAVDDPTTPSCTDAFIRAWPTIPEGDYGRLIQGTRDVLMAYASLPAAIRPTIRACVQEMIAGMRQMAPVQVIGGILFLCGDLNDLDRYCHYVAGVVGTMSTALFETRLDPQVFTPTDAWREQGRRLGLGLQLTNIIKDCQVDAQRGVSFVPPRCVHVDRDSYWLHRAGRADLIRHTIAHLNAALNYILAIPGQETGIRTFLLGAMLPAIATLEVAAPGDQLQPKITREQMGEILSLVNDHVADDAVLSGWYEEHRRRTEALL